MYSLVLECSLTEVEDLSTKLWEAGTVGIREESGRENEAVLIAAFESNSNRQKLLQSFMAQNPAWRHEFDTDWVQYTKDAWPGRRVGNKFFLATTWCDETTPRSRHRLVHVPGLACGTGEHPCTQLALMALERVVAPDQMLVDVGTGSAMLAIGGLQLGARFAIGLDLDEEALHAAQRNLEVNHCDVSLAVGSACAIRDITADLTVANISSTVLLDILPDLQRITRAKGHLILTGFPSVEAAVLAAELNVADTLEIDDWRCLIVRN